MVVIAVPLAVAPNQALEQTAEAALARAMAPIAIESIELVVEADRLKLLVIGPLS